MDQRRHSNAIQWTKLFCRTFTDNQARLQLFALAYNLANFLRRLILPKPVCHWSLTTLQEKPVKIGAKVMRHSKYVTFQLAEVAVTRNSFVAILDRIARLALPAPVAGRIAAEECSGGRKRSSRGRKSARCQQRTPANHLAWRRYGLEGQPQPGRWRKKGEEFTMR